MYIKIYTKSQLVLLRSVNGLFRKKYRLPQEILNRVEATFPKMTAEEERRMEEELYKKIRKFYGDNAV